MFLEGTFIYLVNVIKEVNLFLTSVWVLLLIAENDCDFSVKILSAVSNEKNLQGILYRDSSLESLVEAQELGQVVEFAWFKACLIGDATFIHDLEFIFRNVTIKVVIDLPDDEVYLRLKRFLAKECQNFGEISWSNFALVLLWLLLVSC